VNSSATVAEFAAHLTFAAIRCPDCWVDPSGCPPRPPCRSGRAQLSTRKLRSLLGPLPLDSLKSVPADQNDWYANLLWIDRRKCLLVTHAGTLFSVFVADVHAADVRPIGRFIVPLIERELQVEGLPTDTFGSLTPDDVIITKTADRSVLGCMNDMSFVCESVISGLRRSPSKQYRWPEP